MRAPNPGTAPPQLCPGLAPQGSQVPASCVSLLHQTRTQGCSHLGEEGQQLLAAGTWGHRPPSFLLIRESRANLSPPQSPPLSPKPTCVPRMTLWQDSRPETHGPCLPRSQPLARCPSGLGPLETWALLAHLAPDKENDHSGIQRLCWGF